MFRAYAFLLAKGIGNVRITTEPVDTQDNAYCLLDMLTDQPFVTGGDIEQNVPGIGWVVVEDVETVQIIARRQEPTDDADVLSFLN